MELSGVATSMQFIPPSPTSTLMNLASLVFEIKEGEDGPEQLT